MLIQNIQDLLKAIYDAARNFKRSVLDQGQLFTDVTDTVWTQELSNTILEQYSLNIGLTTVRQNVIERRTPLLTRPELLEIKANERIVYRTVVFGSDGRITVLEGRLRTGEQYTESRHKGHLSSRIKQSDPNIENGSEYIDQALVYSDFFVERIERR